MTLEKLFDLCVFISVSTQGRPTLLIAMIDRQINDRTDKPGAKSAISKALQLQLYILLLYYWWMCKGEIKINRSFIFFPHSFQIFSECLYVQVIAYGAKISQQEWETTYIHVFMKHL